MPTPLHVNDNNIVMLNYQYVFYAVGAYAALHLSHIVEYSNKKKSYIGLAVILTLMTLFFFNALGNNDVIINHSFRLIYVCALWFVLDFLPEIEIRKWMKNSFFLYCSHLMLLQCAQAISEIVIRRIGKYENCLKVAEWVLLPMVVIVLILWVAEVMKNKLQKVWGIITGSRG